MTTNRTPAVRPRLAALAVAAAGCTALLTGAAPATAAPSATAWSEEWEWNWEWEPEDERWDYGAADESDAPDWDNGWDGDLLSWPELPCNENGVVDSEVDQNGNAYDNFGVAANPPVLCYLPEEDVS